MRDDKPSATPAEEAPIFAATLTPHRSLSRHGFVALMLLIGVLALSSGVLFLAVGAWPVLAFLVLDILIIWLAFQVNYHAGRQYEDVTVTPDDLTIRRVSPWGRVTVERFHPVWTRLKTAYDPVDEQVLAIKLESMGRQVAVGSFLNPDDKETFANALGDALKQAKTGRH